MVKEEIQREIDKSEKTPEEMRRIAESYLNGDVLRDNVAAEAWLNKVIATGDHKDSMIAMILLAKKILGKKKAVSEKDLKELRKDYEGSDIREILEYLEQEGETK